ncbi:hypothetical protein QE383_001241 [Pseudoxanthomonas winnipegensis]|uniref:Class I SAM-dependent methyltransferase n=1 Tax=Pseudoxanthomonas winnipegensis TaxID=2480810 RepID=A0AAW8G9S1_9GAMM|nr:hypothetical protein [Pseudoxanthomonas winnipegensis]MDQ1132121.1 hypothetical protein [Pseudoxanthomonas winnipegensis]
MPSEAIPAAGYDWWAHYYDWSRIASQRHDATA